jgi:fructose-1,6-bisphosphatase/inositol monophosphatase family enzyme
VHVRSTAKLEDGLFCFTSVGGWDAAGKLEAFTRLCRTARLTRGWGDCYGHCLVATGRADVAIDPVMSLWDAAALLPILTEAGGLFLSWDGQLTTTGGNGISTTPALKDQVLALLHGRAEPTGRGRD